MISFWWMIGGRIRAVVKSYRNATRVVSLLLYLYLNIQIQISWVGDQLVMSKMRRETKSIVSFLNYPKSVTAISVADIFRRMQRLCPILAPSGLILTMLLIPIPLPSPTHPRHPSMKLSWTPCFLNVAAKEPSSSSCQMLPEERACRRGWQQKTLCPSGTFAAETQRNFVQITQGFILTIWS